LPEQSTTQGFRLNPKVDLRVFLDEDWSAVEALPSCSAEQVQKGKAKHSLKMNAPGKWSEWTSGSLRQSIRPHIWYFSLFDC
jgi:hypothetical protein